MSKQLNAASNATRSVLIDAGRSRG